MKVSELKRNRYQTLSGIETEGEYPGGSFSTKRNRYQTLSGIETITQSFSGDRDNSEIDTKPFQGLKLAAVASEGELTDVAKSIPNPFRD